MAYSIGTREAKETAIDLVNVILGLCLVFAPWALGFTSEMAATRNAWIVGAAIALIALGALFAFREWEEWVNLALGVWAILAPWLLGFATVAAALYAHVIIGLIVGVLAALDLWMIRNRPVLRA
jgi:heme/copper-type cytochrome/quinol oxidase subunit 3